MSSFKTVVDQMGRPVRFYYPPKRIISLVPSQTELLFDLGLESTVVGVTKFCIHPKEKVKPVAKIGGTKQFNLKRIEELKPDLIIGNKEENYEEGITALEKNFPVWMSDIYNIKEAFDMMLKVGEITAKEGQARSIQATIQRSLGEVATKNMGRVAYVIWKDPIMVAAKNTFINEMLRIAGFENAFENFLRYPVVSLTELRDVNPDFLFLSSEPFPFKEKHIKEFETVCSAESIKLVDGEIFSWYGSRLLKAVDYFHNLKTELERL